MDNIRTDQPDRPQGQPEGDPQGGTNDNGSQSR
jgi:hypothetical protein